MTTPQIDPGSTASQPEPRATSFMDWFHVNARWVAVGGVAVVLAAGVAWYVPQQRRMKNENADKQLLTARQSLLSGNTQLAESDLRKVADRYAGTPAGTEAGTLYAQLKLERGDAAGAVTYLQQLMTQVGTGPNAAATRGLLGDALSQTGKTAEAAAEYEKAAGSSTMANEKIVLMSKAAHAFLASGSKSADARRIFEALASQQESAALAAEARVRLGELAATPARS